MAGVDSANPHHAQPLGAHAPGSRGIDPFGDAQRRLVILLVEDHAAAACALSSWLSAFGHRVTTCLMGQDALDALDRDVPDLALIDLGLPDLDGAVVAARLRDVSGGKARCFAVTGRPFLDVGTARLFDGVFEKPLDVRALREVLDACSPEGEEIRAPRVA